MTEDKKTEGHTPWVTGKVNKHLIFRADEFIAECKRPEDAALIVTAVNEQSERSALLRCEAALRKISQSPDDTEARSVARAALPFSTRPAMGSDDYVMVPREPTREWATRLANIRQGQSDTPRCEPPGERAIEVAAEWISHALSAAPPSPRSEGETFVSVPKTPSKEMIEAGASVFSQDGFPDQAFADDARAYYEAMIAAAPPSPRSDDGDGKPVAWRWRWKAPSSDSAGPFGPGWHLRENKPDDDTLKIIEPLFAAPPSPTPSVEVGEMVERLKNEVDGGVMDTSTSDAIFAAVSLLLSLDAERGGLREALKYIYDHDIAYLKCPKPVPNGYPGHYGQVARDVLDSARSALPASDEGTTNE